MPPGSTRERPLAMRWRHCAAIACAAAAGAKALLLMSVNSAEARSLFEAGALATLAHGAMLLLMATWQPGKAKELAPQAAKIRRHAIDKPVSSGVNGARNATLTVTIGAAAGSFSRGEPVLDGLGDTVSHV